MPKSSINFLFKLITSKYSKDAVANELLDYFNDLESARCFAELLCLPHHHHHEKKLKKNSSNNNLNNMNKVVSSSNFVDLASRRGWFVISVIFLFST